MHNININMVRGSSYKKFFTQKFVIQKFLSRKISKSMVLWKQSRLNSTRLFVSKCM